MKILKRILIGAMAIILLLAAGVYVYLLTTKPVYSGAQTLQGLHAEVEVLYDPFGVPHIYAQNADDAYFALGYVHAQDRLFQMEMLRRAVAGRLSEVLGKNLLPTDRLFRTVGIHHLAREQAKQMLGADTSDFQKVAHSYQKGINAFIRNGKTPLEFTIAGIPKTEFTAEDIFLAGGYISFGFAEGIRVDPILEKIRKELGEEYLKSLAVQSPHDAVRIKSFQGPVKTLANDSLISSISKAFEQIPVPLWSGSNGWVIAGNRTASGKPILANDTHFGFAQPATWYEAHLEYPGFSLYGHFIAGIPYAGLGNNKFCAWGFTMFENDDMDFFTETVNPENPNQVKFKDQWENVTSREEIIKVKGEKDEVLTVRSTRHGPIINGIKEDVIPSSSTVSLSWTFNQPENNTLYGIYQLNRASSFEDAKKAATMITSPGFNLMYGDAAGNIAWWAVAKLPIRPAHVNSKLFLDGSSGNDEYLGFYDFSKNPQAINPPWGFVYSANNQPDTVDGILYPGYYYPRSRSGRVFELLSEDKKWTLEEVKKVNLDVRSHMHMDIAKEMVSVLKANYQKEFEVLISTLDNWDGSHQITDIAPSIYYNLLSNVMAMAMKDELGAGPYKTIMGTSIAKNSYDIFIRDENSPWWDNVKTSNTKETRADIFQQAALRTLETLAITSGKNPSDWTWGKIHTVTYNHPLGAVKPLDKLFNVGPLVVPGGDEVINNLHFALDTTGYFPVNGGPALRKITDFGDLDNGETVSPTGQSGNAMSPYYDDQAKMFATGKFRKMMMNRSEIEESSRNRLILKPQ